MKRPSKRSGLPSAPTAASEPPQRRARLVWILCGVLALLVALVFAQTARFDFVNLDDDQYVTTSSLTQLGLSMTGIKQAWTSVQVGNWHPLTTMSFMLDWQLFGMNAAGYHVHNVLLHAANVVLLFLLLRRLTAATWLSALAAALFAIHPLRVESVAWVTERKDVLSGFYFVLTLWAYALYVQRRTPWRYLGVLACFALGLMCKAMLVTLPAVMLLLDYWPLGRLNLNAADPGGPAWKQWMLRAKQLVMEKWALFLLAIVFSTLTAYLSLSAHRVTEILPLRVRLGMAPIACVTYVWKLFYPVNLAANYPYPEQGPPLWQSAMAVALLLAISAAAWLARRRRPYVLAGWLWYLITVLPVVGIIPGGNQIIADRYTYIPLIGLYVALVWALGEAAAAWSQRSRQVAAGLAALVVGALAIAAWHQTSWWRDSETLWRQALKCTSQNAVAHEHLGNALHGTAQAAAASGDLASAQRLTAEAKSEYHQALAIQPRALPSLCNLAAVLSEEGRLDEAIALFRQAIVVNPTVADIYYNQANALRQKGSTEEAIALYRQALKVAPDHALSHNNLGLLLGATGNTAEAAWHYRQAIAARPQFVNPYNNLGDLLLSEGNLAGAELAYRQALQADPTQAATLRNLANVFREKGDFNGAIQCYQMALQHNRQDIAAWNNLGDALNRQGRLEEAIGIYQEAAKLAPQSAVVRYNLGYCLAHKDRKYEALACLREALQLAESQQDTNTVEAILTELKGLTNNAGVQPGAQGEKAPR